MIDLVFQVALSQSQAENNRSASAGLIHERSSDSSQAHLSQTRPNRYYQLKDFSTRITFHPQAAVVKMMLYFGSVMLPAESAFTRGDYSDRFHDDFHDDLLIPRL